MVLSGCSPETGSVTGITRTAAGDLEAVVLTCDGTATKAKEYKSALD